MFEDAEMRVGLVDDQGETDGEDAVVLFLDIRCSGWCVYVPDETVVLSEYCSCERNLSACHSAEYSTSECLFVLSVCLSHR